MAGTSKIRHLALVSESRLVSMDDLLKVSAALQKQATRDVAPIWEITATVDAFAKLESVPDGYSALIVMDNIGFDAAGIHLDKEGQPYALITSSQDLDKWALTASHEMCELLVDPFGNFQETGDSPKEGQGRVSFLVEVCDPSEAAENGYSVNGILVSDFYTPHYFDPVTASGVRYSFTGAIKEPRQVLNGGYLSWTDPVSGHLWQKTWFNGAEPSFRDLGPASATESLRSFVDRRTQIETLKAMAPGRAVARKAGLPLAQGEKSAAGNAARWREEINKVLGRSGRSRGRGPAKVVAKRPRRRRK